MKKALRLVLSAAVASTVMMAAACGRAPSPAPRAGVQTVAKLPTVQAAGKARKLGFNTNRYKTRQARLAHIKHLSPNRARRRAADLRPNCPPIYDQGQLGSCTAFAMAKGLREFIAKRAGDNTALSGLFHYYEERVIEGTVNEDSGATMTDGMTVLADTGVATDTTWPYNISVFTDKPPQAAYDSAGAYKTHDNAQVGNLDDIKTSVDAGNPVVFGFIVYRSFMRIDGSGVMPMPKPGESVLGGHAVMVVGYDDTKKLLTVRNSWSDSWGDHGYFYMPYEFVTDENVMDMWTASN